MAAKLVDSNGALKPFDRWLNDVLPIASHQCGSWLRTEYDTAVIRAQQAAEWKRFERDKDVLPNLKWVPSTSPNFQANIEEVIVVCNNKDAVYSRTEILSKGFIMHEEDFK